MVGTQGPFFSAGDLLFAFAVYIVAGAAINLALRIRRLGRLHSPSHGASPTKLPNPHWFWGDLLSLIGKNNYRRHDWITERFGLLKTRTFRLAGGCVFPPRVITSDPVVVRHMLKDKFDAYPKRLDYIYGFKHLLGDGIFSIDHGPHAPDGGKSWTAQRKGAARIFTRNNFREGMRDVFVRNAVNMAAVLDRVGKTTAVDVQDLWFRYTMDSIGEIGFGVRMGTLELAAASAAGAATPAASRTQRAAHSFARNFDLAHRHMMLFKGSLGVRMLLQLLPPPFSGLAFRIFDRVNANARAFFAAVAALDAFSYRLIRQRRGEGAASLGAKTDLLALFLQEGGVATGGAVGGAVAADASMSDRQLRDVVMSFIIAGRDTTACLLSWATLILVTHPHIERKVREELARELPERATPSFEDATARLPYLAALLKEALRLYPPVPADGKTAAEDDTLPDGSAVGAGTLVTFFPFGMGRSAALWGEDVLEPRPERWLGDGPIIGADGARRQPTFFENPVFQAGPRICLGMNMAVLEASIALAMLLQRYRLRLAEPDRKHTYNPLALTMGIEGGLRVFAEPLP
eukprot:g6811.t1